MAVKMTGLDLAFGWCCWLPSQTTHLDPITLHLSRCKKKNSLKVVKTTPQLIQVNWPRDKWATSKMSHSAAFLMKSLHKYRVCSEKMVLRPCAIRTRYLWVWRRSWKIGSVALLSHNPLKWSAILGLSFFVLCWWP